MEQRFRLVQRGFTRPQRLAERRQVQVSGQIVWKDARGTTRLSRVVTRNVSDTGVAVDCVSGAPIPLYRLVYFQVDRSDRHHPGLPEPLRRQAVLAAVYRVSPCSEDTGVPGGYALRLLVEPQPAAVAIPCEAPQEAIGCAASA
jgi:hypothetical protein